MSKYPRHRYDVIVSKLRTFQSYEHSFSWAVRNSEVLLYLLMAAKWCSAMDFLLFLPFPPNSGIKQLTIVHIPLPHSRIITECIVDVLHLQCKQSVCCCSQCCRIRMVNVAQNAGIGRKRVREWNVNFVWWAAWCYYWEGREGREENL